MCGVAGFLLESRERNKFNFESTLKKMSNAIIHRGPDDSGEWTDKSNGVGLAHRRLSILDLSKAGHQPMISRSGRYVIAFNGEIYNHQEIRTQIEELSNNFMWRGHSDTETILEAFEIFGIEESLNKFTGMFAFSLWDNKNESLTLARDRIGEKPMYYGWQETNKGDVFLFGSELKALKCFPEFIGEVDRGSLTLLLKHAYIPDPYSIYKGIFCLEPGTILEVSLKNKTPKISKYWDSSKIIKKSTNSRYQGSPNDAVQELENLTTSSIKRQMISDVPLGAFLSGGIDSSTIVSLMQAQSSIPIKTFTIGFNEKDFDEAKYAKAIAEYLGTDHTELYITAEDAMKVIPEMPSIYCEPFADPTQIPNFIVSKLASKDVKVVLSGDGGDELFGGYSRYGHINNLWNKVSRFPLASRQVISKSIKLIANKSIYDDELIGSVNNIKRKLVSGADVLSYKTLDELYNHVITQIQYPEEVVKNGYQKSSKLDHLKPDFGKINPIESMMATDTINYLPDDILTKVDRAAMRSSLETRVPFLDHKIIEFAWSLPLSYKIRDGVTKWPLHQILKKHMPEKLTKREKMGFSVPLHEWLRGPLKDWCEDLLNVDRLKREGYFNEIVVEKKWREHLSGYSNHITFLWPILMFQAWLDKE